MPKQEQSNIIMSKEKIFQERLSNYHQKLEKEPSLAFVQKLMQKLPKAEIYLVGGAVRDAALGAAEQKDYDFIVRNVAADQLEAFLKTCGIVNLVGRVFGVFKFVPEGIELKEPIDIALPRTEQAWGTGGYRDVAVQSDPTLPIEEDLARRDFTINALAWDCKNKKIIDAFNGLNDLAKGLIRAVGEPKERFQEDYSRLLRAIRFACQFNFQIEEKTWAAIQQLMTHINDERPLAQPRERKRGGLRKPPILVEKERIVPTETIAKELIKSFYHNPVRAFDLYFQSGAIKELMPELLKMQNCPQPPNFHSEGDVWVHTRLALEKLFSPAFKKEFGEEHPGALLILATLFHDIGKPPTIKMPEETGDRIRFNEHDTEGAKIAGQICRRLTLSSCPENSALHINEQYLHWLIEKHMLAMQGKVEAMKNSTIEKYFFNPLRPGKELLQLTYADVSATVPPDGKPDFTCYLALKKRIVELKKLGIEEKYRLPPPLLNGHEIMEEFKLSSGRKIGELIAALREEQLAGRVKTKEEAIKFLKKYSEFTL